VGNGAAAALERITKLRDQGAISHEEFAAAKERILSAGTVPAEASEERRSFEAAEANMAAPRDLADMSRTPS
jgi:hypothetical protein